MEPENVAVGGHYTINDSLVKESTKVLVSCFKSKTSCDSLNMTSDNTGHASYDPYKSSESEKSTSLGAYYPQIPGRYSLLYNSNRKWVPA
ncbi:O(6)-methylguanine-induced apoptosis 2-like [Xenopus laevis]|uniref:O(6)-methylguanine-induced apoptosis 2-like n=1 Tax=Xenopus laevis TaxID=8355 RepID=A0A8J0U819_XENLA|nr:O(6)-methylguanine-induced apoptosis 2-like [Xenopus laevis]OCT57660.1 hypothetical protein XELAEV_18003224mg [Xenopus laevis]